MAQATENNQPHTPMSHRNREATERDEFAKRSAAKQARMNHPSGKSKYARKAKNGGSAIWEDHPDKEPPLPPQANQYDPFASTESELEYIRSLRERRRQSTGSDRHYFGFGY